jgi:hypothetical protein
LHFYTEDGVIAFGAYEIIKDGQAPGRYRCRMRLPANFLNGTTYRIGIYATSFGPTHVHALLRDALVLDVIDELDSITRQTYPGIFQGAVRPLFDWETTSLNLPSRISVTCSQPEVS